jgi:hypothetical protein
MLAAFASLKHYYSAAEPKATQESVPKVNKNIVSDLYCDV